MKRQIAFLFFTLATIFIGNQTQAQNLRIEGWGDNINGKSIRLIATQDNLTELETQQASKKLKDSDSSFSFSLLIDHSCIMRLQIESFSYSFFAQKGGYYRLHILPFNFAIADSINTLFYQIPLSVIIDSSNDENLNQELYTIDSVIDNFVAQNKKELLFYHNKKAFNTLKQMLLSKEDSIPYNSKTISQRYIADYKTYSLASVAFASKIENQTKLISSLFYNKPILYDNIAYMNCFKQVYSKYYSLGNKRISPHSLDNWLAEGNYFALIDSLGVDSLLKNEVFRELVFLQGAKEMLISGSHDTYQVQNMLSKFHYQTKFPIHKEIEQNIGLLYQKNAHSLVASPTLKLKDINDNEITLDKYKGKPLVLSFVRLNDIACLREMDMQAAFVDSLQNDVNFLTVDCDRTMDALYNFKVNNRKGASYKWDFVHFGGNWDLLEKYNVKVFPTFVLIDKDGVIIQNPMPSPSEGSLIPFLEEQRRKK